MGTYSLCHDLWVVGGKSFPSLWSLFIVLGGNNMGRHGGGAEDVRRRKEHRHQSLGMTFACL